MTRGSLTLFLAGFTGMTAVIMAAAGNHLTSADVPSGLNSSWQAASHMHLAHALALLVLSSFVQHHPRPWLFPAALVLTGGVILFSGSIYLSQLAQWPGANQATPFGGLLLILGWALIILSAFRSTDAE